MTAVQGVVKSTCAGSGKWRVMLLVLAGGLKCGGGKHGG